MWPIFEFSLLKTASMFNSYFFQNFNFHTMLLELAYCRIKMRGTEIIKDLKVHHAFIAEGSTENGRSFFTYSVQVPIYQRVAIRKTL